MATGDEPMLSQPADDNLPMISGRGTKIIADARGAYLAGNLDALIKQMDEAQLARFHRSLIRQVISLTRELPTERPEHIRLAQYIRLAEFWLVEPINANPSRVYPPVLPGWHDNMLEDFAKVVDNAGNLSSAAYYARTWAQYISQPTGSLLPVEAEKREKIIRNVRTGYRWQIEAAWAILQGKEPPSLPNLSA